jgi:predicted DCC family thiol-disulfide oxidoreductase YuxK
MDDQELELRVYFDGACPLCQRIARWLEQQPKYVRLECVPAQAGAAGGCPLSLEALLAQVTVVASDGAVYRGTNAWLICLWALRGYRAWSLRLSGGALRPWAERLFAAVAGVAAWSKRGALVRGTAAR